MILATLVYTLCAALSVTCALLLLRGWARGRQRLLLWSGLCFAWLAVSNVLLFVDLALLEDQADLWWRAAPRSSPAWRRSLAV